METALPTEEVVGGTRSSVIVSDCVEIFSAIIPSDSSLHLIYTVCNDDGQISTFGEVCSTLPRRLRHSSIDDGVFVIQCNECSLVDHHCMHTIPIPSFIFSFDSATSLLNHLYPLWCCCQLLQSIAAADTISLPTNLGTYYLPTFLDRYCCCST